METPEALALDELLRRVGEVHSPRPEVTFFDDALGVDLVHALVEAPPQLGKGYGIGATPNLALAKAYSEWVERGIFYDVAKSRGAKTTNGFAAHPNPAKAVESARLELIERDAFLTCWHAGRPPRWLSEQEIAQMDHDGGITSQCEHFLKHGFKLRLGIVGSSLGANVVVSSMTALPPSPLAGGIAIQTSASPALETAFRHVIETQRAVATVVLNRSKLGVKSDRTELRQPRDLLDHFLDPTNAANLAWYVEGCDEPVLFPPEEVTLETFKPQAAWDLTVARASSPQMQEYYGVGTEHPPIHWARLHRVFPDLEKMNPRQHPLS